MTFTIVYIIIYTRGDTKLKYKKICVICGEEFETNVHNKSVCNRDHYHKCPVCGKLILSNDIQRQNSTCSRKCGQILGNNKRRETSLEKYGVENPAQRKEVKEVISKKLSDLHPKQEIKYKKCEVCGKEFELHWPYTQHTCSPKCRGQYRKMTGVSRSVYQKACETNFQRYGFENQGERSEIHKKMEDTMEERYGVRYARYLPEVEERVRKTCLERYGVPYYIQTEDANKDNRKRISFINEKFSKFLSDNGIDNSLEKFLGGKFYDIVMEDRKIVIEIDPTYTHNSIGNHWNSHGIDSNYHKDKSMIAIEHGYRCIHVFDWDNWNDILNILKAPHTTIGARKCEVREVDKSDAVKFTNAYHIQHSCNGQVLNYGLYFNNELIQIMTFGKPRYNNKYDYELLRLCSNTDIRVVGGASKLFHAFTSDNMNSSVISYCDRSKFNGSVYQAIGMNLLRITPPSKIWSKGTDKITDNLLRQRGYDQLFDTHFGKGTSNEQLMIESKWLPVFDCGQYVYSYLP